MNTPAENVLSLNEPGRGNRAEQKPAAKRRVRTRRKPFFGFPIMAHYAKGYRAMAKCLGLTQRQLFDSCLFAWEEKAEVSLGFGVLEASRLTRKDIASIASQMKIVRGILWRGGNNKRN